MLSSTDFDYLLQILVWQIILTILKILFDIFAGIHVAYGCMCVHLSAFAKYKIVMHVMTFL